MSNFQLLSRTRQITEYSCGASALQAVLGYWGRELDETAIMKLIGTSSDVGSYPENIVRGVRALGLEAELRDNLSLDEVRRFGHPMIALAQVWRSQRSSALRPEEDWDNGHYIVVLGVDDEHVYFQDPYLRMGKAFVPRETFERHWHQIMGGEAAANPVLDHLGIFIRGERPAAVATTPAALPRMDFGKLGSLNLMVTHFPGVLWPVAFMDELRELWASSEVRHGCVRAGEQGCQRQNFGDGGRPARERRRRTGNQRAAGHDREPPGRCRGVHGRPHRICNPCCRSGRFRSDGG